ncbi:MAG: universal stress protein [Gammaproteobacteria bacterium]|jgi:nucleotide-binding universal stress UspA family protein|nr:universal stress protein [Gammaproteobacteria bacterium]
MAFKDLLVHVDGSKASTVRVDVAIRLAQTHSAHLTGLYVLPYFEIPVYAEVQIPDDILAAQRQAALARAAEAEKAFRVATDKARLSSEWRFVEDRLAPTLALHARYVDLVIVGQRGDTDPSSMSNGVAEHVVLQSGRPTLVVPYIGAPDSIGKHVLVAWNASREAVRAVHEAMPFLEQAQTVTVLAINPSEHTDEDRIPSADICQHLARHDVNADATHIEAHDIAVGDMLLSRAADRGVDLIVMGAYGHSRFREFVLGGATRNLLEHMTVPVLMAH